MVSLLCVKAMPFRAVARQMPVREQSLLEIDGRSPLLSLNFPTVAFASSHAGLRAVKVMQKQSLEHRCANVRYVALS